MDFTREPIIETVVTPKEGCKLVVRSSKSAGQEEYFVDAVEVVSFSQALFFRSLERPKAFLVPATDYEVLEVREARMILKNVGVERSIKIGSKPPREAAVEKTEPVAQPEASVAEPAVASADQKEEPRTERRRDRRRNARRRRGSPEEAEAAEKVEMEGEKVTSTVDKPPPTLLPPPAMLISETIARYRDNNLFSGAFYVKDEAEKVAGAEIAAEGESTLHRQSAEELLEVFDFHNVTLEPSEFGSFGSLDDEESPMTTSESPAESEKKNEEEST